MLLQQSLTFAAVTKQNLRGACFGFAKLQPATLLPRSCSQRGALARVAYSSEGFVGQQ